MTESRGGVGEEQARAVSASYAVVAPGARDALDLARRQWDAEEENARRLGARSNGVLGAIAALSGLGIFKIGSLASLGSTWPTHWLRGLLSLALACMFVGLLHVWGVQPPPNSDNERWWRLDKKGLRLLIRISRPSSRGNNNGPRHATGPDPRPSLASSYLLTSEDLTDDSVEEPLHLPALEPAEVQELAYLRTVEAAMDLHFRNMERREDLIAGQVWLFRAAVWIFLAILTALWLEAATPSGSGTSGRSERLGLPAAEEEGNLSHTR